MEIFGKLRNDKKKGNIEIFMSFPEKTKKIWICPNCGTHNSYNDESVMMCVVCGLKKEKD